MDPRTDTGSRDAADGHEPSSEERAEHPGSVFPMAGEHVAEGETEAALDAMPAGNATTADMVDTDAVDSRAHDA